MWTGGKPPPAPAAADTPSKSYRSDKQQSELDALRQRGLAKLLNRHFTNVTQNLAEERAAADAALRELEARKAEGFKDFSDKEGEELSIWDKLYLELQQKKAECKRKERETLLLYQRYVDKFGGTGVVAVPRSQAVTPDAKAANGRYQAGLTGVSTRVPHLAGQIESNLASASNGTPISHSGIKWTKSQQEAVAAMDPQERAAFLRSLEGDSRGSPQVQKLMDGGNDSIPESPQLASDFPKWEENTPTTSFLTRSTVGTEVSKRESPGVDVFQVDDLDEDIRSIVSGLTSGDFSDAERALVEFLRTETDAIRKLLEDEDHASVVSLTSSYSNEMRSQSARAADEAEDLVKKMDSLLRDFQSDEQSAAAAAASNEPRKLKTTNPDEEWMVYWDEMAQRHYYYDLKTNKAQWAKPASAIEAGSRDAVPMADFTRSHSDRTIPLTFDEVMPLDDVPRQSRRDQYRRMRRRRRNRRLFFLAFLITGTVGAGLYVNRFHHDEVKSNLTRALGSEQQAEKVIDTIETYFPDSVTGRSERNEKRIREENIRKAQLEKARQEQLAAEEKARAAQQVVVHEPKKEEFLSWACQNPHFFFVTNRRGLC
jgi:hypothetical protein